MTEIATIKFETMKGDHDKVLKAVRDYMDYEFAHPELFKYTSTRFYFMDAPDNPEVEVWLCVDHFEDFDEYAASLEEAREKDPDTLKYFMAVFSLLVPGSDVTRDRWTEAEELAVEMPTASANDAGA
jgi:hypothetical protein